MEPRPGASPGEPPTAASLAVAPVQAGARSLSWSYPGRGPAIEGHRLASSSTTAYAVLAADAAAFEGTAALSSSPATFVGATAIPRL